MCVIGIQAATVPVASITAGAKYNIKHVASGLYLQHLENNDGDYCINPLIPGNAEFEFDFTAVTGEGIAENTFNIRADGLYLTGTNYNIQSGSLTDNNNSHIILTPTGTDDQFTMKSAWSNFINSNGTTARSRFYADKGAGAVWVLEPAAAKPSNIIVQTYYPAQDATDVNNVASTVIKLTFDAAPELSGSRTATFDVNGAGNPASVTPTVSGLDLVIPHGALAYSTTYTVNIPNGFLSNYSGGISWSFTTCAGPVLPQNGKRYNIVHSSGKYLTINGTTVVLADRQATDVQGILRYSHSAQTQAIRLTSILQQPKAIFTTTAVGMLISRQRSMAQRMKKSPLPPMEVISISGL